MNLSSHQQRALLDLARGGLRQGLTGKTCPAPECDDLALRQPAGCFVSLHRLHTHALRGCVGRIEAKGPLWDEIWATGAGVLKDPRFRDDPVSLQELPQLEVELSILSPLIPATGVLEFDPANDGIYLTCGRRTGCFLPQVGRETGWTREHLLSRLCTEKMGLPAAGWRVPDARLMTFTTLVIGPSPIESVNASGGLQE